MKSNHNTFTIDADGNTEQSNKIQTADIQSNKKDCSSDSISVNAAEMSDKENEPSINNEKENIRHDKIRSFFENSNIKNIKSCFTDLGMSLQEFYKNLPVLSTKQIKKLYMLTMQDFINIEELVELTRESDRNTRYLSTICCLTKIKNLLVHYKLKKDMLVDIIDLFNCTVGLRCKDVDPAIRGACCDFMAGFMNSDNMFFAEEYSKYLGLGLLDKSDSVRKKALKGCRSILKKKITGTRNRKAKDINEERERNLKRFFNKYKDALLNCCLIIKNDKILTECTGLAVELYKKSIFGVEDLSKILQYMDDNNINLFFRDFKIDKDLKEAIKWVYNIDPFLLEKINITEEEMMGLTMGCNEPEELKLLYFLVRKDHNIVENMILLLNTHKEDIRSMQVIIKIMCKIDDEYYNVEQSGLIDQLIRLSEIHKSADLLTTIYSLFKKVQGVFQSKINLHIENYAMNGNKENLVCLLRSFDLSELADNNDTLEIKILATLWKMTKNDFVFVTEMNFDVNNVDEFQVACKFLLHCHDSLVLNGVEDTEYESCYDAVSGMNFLYYRLKTSIESFLDNYFGNYSQKNEFNFKDSISEMTKNDKNVKNLKYDKKIVDEYTKVAFLLPKHLILIFYGGIKDTIQAISKLKENHEELTDSFFKYLITENTVSLSEIKQISQIIYRKIKNVNPYNWIIRLITKETLYDTCLQFFVKLCTPAECAYLEELVKVKSKFKSALIKRSTTHFRSSPVNEEKEEAIHL